MGELLALKFAFSYALCKVLHCKTFIIASVFNSYKATPHNSRLTA